MRPYLRGLRDRDLQHRIERLALDYLDGRAEMIDRRAAGTPAPASLAHHEAAARFHVRARDELGRGSVLGLTSTAFTQFLGTCCRHLESGRVRAVLVGGAAEALASAVAASLCAEHGAILLGSADAHVAERLLRRGEHVVVRAPFERDLERRIFRDVGMRTSSGVIELACATPTSTGGVAPDPWPEATVVGNDSFANALERARLACGWSSR